jgi:alpha-1,3-fucosyltransferase 10
LYQQYKFTLAFENSFAPDYVTEKFWLPLMAGSVPVYRGTEAVTELAPAPGCYIDARDFASATELGAYLDDLDRDDAAYARFHEWRADDVSDAFKELTARLEEPLLCRLANAISVRRSRPPPASGRRHRRPGTGRR